MNANKTTTPWRKRLSLAKALALVALISVTHAQSPPVSSRRMGFTMLDDTLYIEGGFDTDTSSQFNALDLSTSWSTDSPAWRNLKSGQSTSHLALTPISSASNGGAKGSLMAIGGMESPAFYSMFDIDAGTWTNLTIKAPYVSLEGQSAVSDPNTGLIYILGGVGINNTVYNQLTVYDPKAKNTVSQQTSSAAASIIDQGAVWSTTRNTIITFGGTRAPPADPKGLGTGDLNEYDPSSKSWKIMSTTGDIPPSRLDHCMAASSDGSKIVVFGGTAGDSTYFNTIYILDVKSGKWKQGQSAPVARTRMSCAFHSYQFIAWGGSSGANRATMLNNLPVVYNLNKNSWTDNYNADEVEKKTPVGAIVGVIFGVLIVAGGGFFFYKRQQRKKQENDAYYNDAVAAAAVTSCEDDNVKVLADEIYIGYDNSSGFSGYGNEYPLSNVSTGSPLGSEKYGNSYSPSTNPYSPSPTYYGGALIGTPIIQSPSAAFVAHQNPFVSPEDYYPPASNIQNPYQQYQQPSATNYAGSQSPSTGARSPQVIPDSTTTTTTTSGGYIPPPPM
ncbi:hypothetical protein BGZ80_000094 [Entomortierella chlamydospora]|uniref:Galactose oxidase n=1 Tax=Entomortierella chlamydospora TaxID=101097 RepID=A0A9P6SYU0_9FUNG|nr:hypothetical protein BGZ80_000094 [Entomortierella chlamydospora]